MLKYGGHKNRFNSPRVCSQKNINYEKHYSINISGSSIEKLTFFLKDTCSLEYLNCRMKCNPDEHAIKYCADWTICCKAKNTKFKRKKKW
ncbi:beta-defensin 131A-like [Canis lupus dingo]|uniref:beta-defensin 131A-like n=1 Tax=Canis lupus dingo TaxID=286419 RepID=UPI000DC6712B|nr:beta-defensin 131A-like [Canis lupus dingo]